MSFIQASFCSPRYSILHPYILDALNSKQFVSKQEIIGIRRFWPIFKYYFSHIKTVYQCITVLRGHACLWLRFFKFSRTKKIEPFFRCIFCLLVSLEWFFLYILSAKGKGTCQHWEKKNDRNLSLQTYAANCFGNCTKLYLWALFESRQVNV